MKIYSSAKINLNLIIDNNVVNGLHTLSTLMIPVNLFDEIEIREIDTDDDIIEFTPQIQMNGESTIHKALQCLVMKRVIRELKGTRHAGNAAHKLRELEEG